MASYTKRGNTWQFTVSRYVDGEYKPIRKGGFRTKKEASIVATEIEDKLNKNNTLHLKPVKFSDYFYDWIRAYKTHVTNSTFERYIYSYKTIQKYFKDTYIQDITKRDYQIFINDYAKTRHKASVKKINSQIRQCVMDAIDEGYIGTNFTRNIMLGGKNTSKKADVTLDYNEVRALNDLLKLKIDNMIKTYEIAQTNIDLRYVAIYLALNTGMRFGEIVGLTYDDIDFEEQKVNVHQTWGYVKSTGLGFQPTKTQEDRVIKIGNDTCYILQRIKPITRENEHNLIFYHPESKYDVINNSSTNKLVKDLVTDLGIKKDLTFHILRHTHASVLLYKDISIQYVSERLGHSDIMTTYQFYSHVLEELRIEDENKSIEIFS